MLTTSMATTFRCPRCQATPLSVDGARVRCSVCHWTSEVEAGVLDLLAHQDIAVAPEDAAPRNAVNPAIGEQVRGLASSLGLIGTAQNIKDLTAVLTPVTPTGNAFFDAEEEIFLERFAIKNFEVNPLLGPVYLPKQAAKGALFWGAVRITNKGSFPIVSDGQHPFFISYHIYQHGHLVDFEGIRTQLPVMLKPGMAVTVPIQIQAPASEGDYEIAFTALQEGLKWFEDDAMRASITVNAAGVPLHPDATEGQLFSETLDTVLAAGFVDSTFPKLEDGVVLEIGGGIRPSFQSCAVGRDWLGVFINCDVSLRLLRVAHFLANPGGQSRVIQARMDANRLAICDQSIDAVFISRAIHHFENLRILLVELRRVIKPGGSIYLLCEPIGTQYDDFVKGLISQGVNEQVFPPGVYERLLEECGFTLSSAQRDWGFSFKGHFIRN